ncbi:hydrogenase expression/formation protein HypE [Immundisolibacter sp.]|uniref:hydrogenase expression/formation protein HypE n=1 Tax=Immundisolibacter sp. TaxID=1934948 RepID=UPI00261FED42|nr:hydrogenase expression/formation protein HypE [Immundisolibacter sp.]MDD3650905.1 hydrogenase expression/formation protein HypE [Immundisolibacter sp.]
MFDPACPLPFTDYPAVLLAHGAGGRLMHQLLEQLVLPALGGPAAAQHDAAVLAPADGRPALTTDSYVVRPLFFPGGDIGTLAVYGTVNDLAMAGARPRALSLALIIEEGLPMDSLWRVLCSVRAAADAVGVPVVTGDTKVVERGRGDGLYITSTGLGTVPPGVDLRPARIADGDAVLLSGDIGRHGIAVLAQREGLAFETALLSDCAPLHQVIAALLAAGIDLHCARDLTRGGLAAAVVELAMQSGRGVRLEEAAIAVSAPVAAACELLGFEPLHVACEGRLVTYVPAAQADAALAILRAAPGGEQAACIGRVGGRGVVLRGPFGVERPLDLPAGELLPRIC